MANTPNSKEQSYKDWTGRFMRMRLELVTLSTLLLFVAVFDKKYEKIETINFFIIKFEKIKLDEHITFVAWAILFFWLYLCIAFIARVFTEIRQLSKANELKVEANNFLENISTEISNWKKNIPKLNQLSKEIQLDLDNIFSARKGFISDEGCIKHQKDRLERAIHLSKALNRKGYDSTDISDDTKNTLDYVIQQNTEENHELKRIITENNQTLEERISNLSELSLGNNSFLKSFPKEIEKYKLVLDRMDNRSRLGQIGELFDKNIFGFIVPIIYSITAIIYFLKETGMHSHLIP